MTGQKEEKRFVCQISIRGGESILIGSGGTDADEESALQAACADILGVLERARKERAEAEAERVAQE